MYGPHPRTLGPAGFFLLLTVLSLARPIHMRMTLDNLWRGSDRIQSFTVLFCNEWSQNSVRFQTLPSEFLLPFWSVISCVANPEQTQ